MRNAPGFVFLILAAVVVSGCAARDSAASGPDKSPGNRSASSADGGPGAVDEASAESPDTVSERVSAALESAGVEGLRSDGAAPWNPDFSGTWRDEPAFAWLVDPESVGQVAEVRGSAELRGAHGSVTAVVHGPELALVRVPCQDLVVDVAAGVDVDTGTSDDGIAIELARALYPALGC